MTSGWNCTPRLRPTVNACTHRSSAASTRGRDGWLDAVVVPLHPRARRADRTTSPSSGCQPICGRSARTTCPPWAVASAWAPKQIPSTGTSAASARRRKSSSSAIHAERRRLVHRADRTHRDDDVVVGSARRGRHVERVAVLVAQDHDRSSSNPRWRRRSPTSAGPLPGFAVRSPARARPGSYRSALSVSARSA